MKTMSWKNRDGFAELTVLLSKKEIERYRATGILVNQDIYENNKIIEIMEDEENEFKKPISRS